jgi:hypothetical protein
VGVTILKIFSPKNLAKIFAFWTKNTVNSEEQNNHSITFQEKR